MALLHVVRNDYNESTKYESEDMVLYEKESAKDKT